MEQKRKSGGKSENSEIPIPNPIVNDAQIHKDNADRLAQMSRDEIESERQELLARLDPSMLEFIRKRRYGKTSDTGVQSETKPKQVKFDPKPIYKTETGSEVKVPLEKVDKNWVNFENVEPDKLEWMQDVKLREIQGEVKIRVDFDGNVMNPLSEVSWREGLHHHGDDEQLPGG